MCRQQREEKRKAETGAERQMTMEEIGESSGEKGTSRLKASHE